MTLAFLNAYGAVSRPQMDAHLAAELGLQGVATSADSRYHLVQHSELTEADRPRIQAALDRYVFDPTYGAAPPVKTLEERLAALEAAIPVR